ncbi:MAG: hypothetical protein AAFZ18_19935, partial [Myxococcota bacterium]
SALAVMMRELSPSVPASTGGNPRTEIRSVDVFEEFTTTSARLATALEEVYARHRGLSPVPPAVVNLSLGWPPLLSHPEAVRPICGRVATTYRNGSWQREKCSDQEGALGEPVRFALALLRFGLPGPVTTVAAPGNQPADLGVLTSSPASSLPSLQAERFLGRLNEAGTTECGGEGWSLGDYIEAAPELLFYPAYWGRADARQNPLTRTPSRGTQLAVPAGARDHRGYRVRSTLPGVPLDFELPGQHVYVPADFIHPSNGTLSLVTGPHVRDATAAFPAGPSDSPVVLDARTAHVTSQAWTGTSISTALLSASLAEAHLAYQAARSNAGTGPGMRALLYASGVDYQDGGRRPNLCRLRRALNAPGQTACRANVDGCYKASSGQPDTWSSVARNDRACESLRTSCAKIWTGCSRDGEPGPWPGQVLASPRGTSSSVTPCGGSSACIELSASGSLGPQPPTSLCPDCPYILAVAPGQIDVAFTVNKAARLAIALSRPVIHLELSSGKVSRQLTGLAPLTPGSYHRVVLDGLLISDESEIVSALLQLEATDTTQPMPQPVSQFADFPLD